MREAMLSGAKSFKVETKRADKSFPMTSIELARYVGRGACRRLPRHAVASTERELTVHVECSGPPGLCPRRAPCPERAACGGLRAATRVTLLSGGIDSPVSTYMIAKRGVHMIPVHFFSFPYTSELAKQKVLDLAKVLTAYCGRMTVEVVPFTHIQTEIRDKCPEEYFTLIMRRFMMRIAQRIADQYGARALVSGENLVQVDTRPGGAGVHEAVCAPPCAPLIALTRGNRALSRKSAP
jgi:thiamine biosynthesis protein ThiI